MKIIMHKHIFLIFVTLVLSLQLRAQKDTLLNVSDSTIVVSDSLKSNTMSLLFIGDLMGHGSQIRSALNPDKNEYSYDTVFHYLKDIMSEPDFTIANLEVTLAGPPFKGYPQFSSPDALAVDAAEAGIDIFVTANNHSVDRRLHGINRTIDVLDSLSIPHTGTFKNKDARDTTNLIIIEKDSIRVGLLNYTYGTNGIPVPKPSVVNLIDRDIMKSDIDSANNKGLDKLIVFLHFGSEYQSSPNISQTGLVNFLFEEGVDIVIGSHPHVIQLMEHHKVFENDSMHENFVAYSLGNFVSNQRKTKTDGGVMARLVLKKENGKTYIDKSNYILTWVYKKIRVGETYDFFILPAAEFENNKSFFKNQADYNKMMLYVKNSRSLLNNGNMNVEEYSKEEKHKTDKQINE